MLTRLRHPFRRFARDDRGSVTLEAVIVLPVLIWAHAALFAYWDVYRTINTVQKASYTISDLISRQQGSVNNAYLNGMRSTLAYLLDDDQDATMRITSYRWSENRNRYEVIWSNSDMPGKPALTTGTIAELTGALPEMADGDSAILVETEVPYIPALRFGLSPTDIEQFIVTRPRFLTRICHTGYSCS
ncbi:TadE/TadG family type IV pilus assembly protein [Szabonella alba]|uniref:Pilus assembly protein n=1 Tax=Szabonella alba TaxID=2804194 RepID=A0A8K0V9V1_9RHOB|nr:TadE/TadG family type IV pilus assembly protein [Szabonella alba]MBL4916025.1 pilus assembly protein [Szabonella alba]